MDPDRARELLAARRRDVEGALADLVRRSPEDVPDPFDPGDVASDTLDAELSEGLGEQLREELGAIERAEARLAEGTYGLSVDSGEPIADGRLEAIPWAERTAEEQARLDRQGG
jgi:RNA polymerase-binding transcription factor